MRTLAERQEYWDRLRYDPDFTRDWLRAMGPRPTVQTAREWGDGATKSASTHRIAEVSHEADLIVCECGWRGSARGGLDWDAHRLSAQTSATKRVQSGGLGQASDEEVAAFMAHLSGEHVPSEPAAMSNTEQSGEGKAHEECRHGTFCLVGYGALHTVLFDPTFPFDRYYPEEEFA